VLLNGFGKIFGKTAVYFICFFVDAKDEKARKYYEQFGFIPMPDNKQQLFLAMNDLQQAYQTIS